MRDIDREGMIFRIEDSGEAVLTECSQAAPVLTIPAAVDGYPLTAIDPDAFDQAGPFEAFRIAGESAHFNTVDGVLFDRTGERLVRYPLGRDAVAYAPPVGTKVIGQNAFAGVEKLTRVTLPEGVTMIESRAFADSPALTELELPVSLERYGHEVLRGCSRLTEVSVPAGHPFLRREKCFLIDTSDSVLLGCLPGGGERELVAPEDIRYVDEYAFRGCDALQKIHFHHGLRTLGRYAFYHCEALRTVELPEGLRSIGTRAFSGCTALRSLYVPDSVTSIEYKAFNNCEHLVLQVNKGSYTDRYCRQFGFPCRHRIQWPWDRNRD